MEERENKIIGTVKILFRSMKQSLDDMGRGDFEMNSTAFMEKAKALVRFLEEETVNKKLKKPIDSIFFYDKIRIVAGKQRQER